jgi:two-component system sensor histidine kinase BaeS
VDALADAYAEQRSWKGFDEKSWRDMAATFDMARRPGPPGSLFPPPERPPRDAAPPLVLFDEGQNALAGPETPLDELVMRPIEVEGRVVGWLGLKIARDFEHDLNLNFFEKQTRAFYVTGAIALILAIISALFFTRWIVGPIHRLSSGTRAIAKRDWSVRLPVKSNDELGEPASSFNQMAASLERYEQMRAQWISDISHELRTPLSILRGEVEALQDGIREPDKEAMDNLHAEVMRLGRIVEDMHNLAMADNGTLTYEFKPINTLAVLSRAVDRQQPRFDEKQIALERRLEGEVTINADSARLEQLFGNLLENTLRYTDSPGRLKIGHAITDAKLGITFEDSAPGVGDDDLERIFDRLYRVDKARSRATGGSGLGLAICKTIVEAHDGSIYASHGDLGGLKITVEFPIGVA